MFRYNQKLRSGDIIPDESENEGHAVSSIMDQVDEYKKEKDHGYIVTLIGEYFSQKLFNIVGEIFVRKEDKDQELIEFHAEENRDNVDDAEEGADDDEE